MRTTMPCPKCGKQMFEAPEFPGLFMCPDYKNAINSAPPFQYKCTGCEFTDKAVDALVSELTRVSVQQN